MIKTPQDLKYTSSHEWIRKEPDDTLTVGITDFAQEALGDIVFIEFPPVAGEIVAVNDSLKDAWEALNKDAFAAWLFKMKPANAGDLAGLLDAAAYAASAEASH
jgi:glycine cleavage system H protein